MANRIITALPYFQAPEFVVGANHPDGLADTINRGLIEAWGLVKPQLRETIRMEYYNRNQIKILPGIVPLDTGDIMVIDTEVLVYIPANDYTNKPTINIFAGFLGGSVGFQPSSNRAYTGLTRTRFSVQRHDYASGCVAPFVICGNWCYTTVYNRSAVFASVASSATPTDVIIYGSNGSETGNAPDAPAILVYYTLTPTETATVDFYVKLPVSAYGPAYVIPLPFHRVSLTGTTPQSGYLTIPLVNQGFMLQVSAGTVTVDMSLRGYQFE